MRPQWTREWLIAPFGAPTFWSRAEDFTPAVLQNKTHRLAKLAVWFQAEKTRANPYVLDRTFGSAQLGGAKLSGWLIYLRGLRNRRAGVAFARGVFITSRNFL